MESNPQGGGMDVEPVADQLGAHAAAAGIVEHSAHPARTPMGQAALGFVHKKDAQVVGAVGL